MLHGPVLSSSASCVPLSSLSSAVQTLSSCAVAVWGLLVLRVKGTEDGPDIDLASPHPTCDFRDSRYALHAWHETKQLHLLTQTSAAGERAHACAWTPSRKFLLDARAVPKEPLTAEGAAWARSELRARDTAAAYVAQHSRGHRSRTGAPLAPLEGLCGTCQRALPSPKVALRSAC
jgi:hypothetical protein